MLTYRHNHRGLYFFIQIKKIIFPNFESTSAFHIDSRNNKSLPKKYDRVKINTLSNNTSAAEDHLKIAVTSA
jgi:hypothetical protein